MLEVLAREGAGTPDRAAHGPREAASRSTPSPCPALEHFRDHATTLDGVIASHTTRLFVVIDNARPELGAGQYVTGNFFQVLGVPALIGRTV